MSCMSHRDGNAACRHVAMSPCFFTPCPPSCIGVFPANNSARLVPEPTCPSESSVFTHGRVPFLSRATYKELVHIHPMGKFLAIKTIVFFSWWQVRPSIIKHAMRKCAFANGVQVLARFSSRAVECCWRLTGLAIPETRRLRSPRSSLPPAFCLLFISC